MKKIALVVSVFALFANSAFAHIEPGTYTGKTPAGVACAMRAGKNYFEPAQNHPLNERIQIQFGSDQFIVGHPPLIDPVKGTAYFNHDAFHGVLATQVGARAIVIEMVHEKRVRVEGPHAFQVIDHNWKTGAHQIVRCANLQFTPQ